MRNIFIADDHPILMRGLKEFLESKGWTVIGTESNGRSALNFIVKNEPNIAILDISMPLLTGIEVAERCKKINSPTKIIFLTSHREIDFYLKAREYNIFGYLLKESALEEIEECLLSVINNTPYFSKKISKHLQFKEESDSLLKRLTMSEIRILKYVSESKSSSEIARLLFISPRTVERHKSNIIQKLELETENRALNKWVEKNKNLFF